MTREYNDFKIGSESDFYNMREAYTARTHSPMTPEIFRQTITTEAPPQGVRPLDLIFPNLRRMESGLNHFLKYLPRGERRRTIEDILFEVRNQVQAFPEFYNGLTGISFVLPEFIPPRVSSYCVALREVMQALLDNLDALFSLYMAEQNAERRERIVREFNNAISLARNLSRLICAFSR